MRTLKGKSIAVIAGAVVIGLTACGGSTGSGTASTGSRGGPASANSTSQISTISGCTSGSAASAASCSQTNTSVGSLTFAENPTAGTTPALGNYTPLYGNEPGVPIAGGTNGTTATTTVPANATTTTTCNGAIQNCNPGSAPANNGPANNSGGMIDPNALATP